MNNNMTAGHGIEALCATCGRGMATWVKQELNMKNWNVVPTFEEAKEKFKNSDVCAVRNNIVCMNYHTV